MKGIAYIGVLALFLGTFAPSTAMAQSLTRNQVEAVLVLLKAFNVDKHTMSNIENSLNSASSTPEAPKFKVVGKTADGQDVFQGTMPFVINPDTGCHHVASLKKGDEHYTVNAAPYFCPPKTIK